MPEADGAATDNPLLQPRLIRFLKNRDRLIDRGFREEFLEQLELNVVRRRTPDTVAEGVTKEGFKRLEEVGGDVAKGRVKNAVDRANKGPLKKL